MLSVFVFKYINRYYYHYVKLWLSQWPPLLCPRGQFSIMNHLFLWNIEAKRNAWRFVDIFAFTFMQFCWNLFRIFHLTWGLHSFRKWLGTRITISIVWNNDDLFYWWVNALLGLNVLHKKLILYGTHLNGSWWLQQRTTMDTQHADF